jgi:CheY-like chemotaxis protein
MDRTKLRPRVLVVERDPVALRTMGSWLHDEGFDVLLCPGPQAPGYECPFASGATCLLAHRADVIVLDLWLESDTVFRGNPGVEVLFYYLGLGKAVVALAAADDPAVPAPDERVAVLPRPPEREALVAAVRNLVKNRPRASNSRTRWNL